MESWNAIVRPGRRIILHVGCGTQSTEHLPPFDFETEWQEVRVDIDPSVGPDVVASIADIAGVPDGAVDCVFSKHNIEHVEHHEVARVLRSFHRVLKPTGFLLRLTPDLQQVCRLVADGKLEEVLYTARWNGELIPIAPIDIIYGSRHQIAGGNGFMAHRTGFTADTLRRHIEEAGFTAVTVTHALHELRARACKVDAGNLLHRFCR